MKVKRMLAHFVCMSLSISLIACSSAGDSSSQSDTSAGAESTESTPATESETEATEGSTTEAESEEASSSDITFGATVTADPDSPTGYAVTFAYDASDSKTPVESVSVTGPFRFVDPDLDLMDENNWFDPEDYEDGMYPSNFIPSLGMTEGWGYTQEMTDEDGDSIYTTSFPIASGSYAYNYVIQYEGVEEPVNIDDPVNPSPAKNNPDSITETSDIIHSIVYGAYDGEKQSQSLNLDFVLPTESNAGEQFYVSYVGVDGVTQYLGVYLPADYDPDREEPYKTIYTSHGGGGNETDWFAMGHVDNIMDNLSVDGLVEEAIIVTMDNAHYEWDYDQIESNVLDCIIPYMEENYNVSTQPQDRAFCGLSMGGMTTTNMYFDHPTEFGYFGIFSGTDMTAVKDTDGIKEPTVMVAVGTCDIASENIMPNTDPEALMKYEDLVNWAEENSMTNIHAAGYYHGAHDWFTWSQCFYHFVTEYLWK